MFQKEPHILCLSLSTINSLYSYTAVKPGSQHWQSSYTKSDVFQNHFICTHLLMCCVQSSVQLFHMRAFVCQDIENFSYFKLLFF